MSTQMIGIFERVKQRELIEALAEFNQERFKKGFEAWLNDHTKRDELPLHLTAYGDKTKEHPSLERMYRRKDFHRIRLLGLLNSMLDSETQIRQHSDLVKLMINRDHEYTVEQLVEGGIGEVFAELHRILEFGLLVGFTPQDHRYWHFPHEKYTRNSERVLIEYTPELSLQSGIIQSVVLVLSKKPHNARDFNLDQLFAGRGSIVSWVLHERLHNLFGVTQCLDGDEDGLLICGLERFAQEYLEAICSVLIQHTTTVEHVMAHGRLPEKKQSFFKRVLGGFGS